MNPIQAKFKEIHEDLEANVTKIYERRDLLTLLDLVIHSVLEFRFQGELVRKGWVEGLVIGDTRCGKSETADRLLRHYRCGEIVTGENATYAGLVGGLQQTQKTWSITWGKFPLNDRRMLTIDELSGLPHEAIARMSGIRSSGVAEIIKIQTERTAARVRTAWLSNPRAKRPLASFNTAMDAIIDLVGHPEDIARFDMALTVATGEVPLEVINARTRPQVPARFGSEACNRLVYWAWSRGREQVLWEAGVENSILDHASRMARKYCAPLVEGAEQRIKIARLAVAAAARVFSASSDGETVVVKTEHVEFVCEYLDQIYCKPSMAFDLYSSAKHSETHLNAASEIQTKLDGLPKQFIGLLGDAQSFTVADLQDFAGLDRDHAGQLAAFLVQHRATKRGKFGYYKLPSFIQFLRKYRHGERHEREPGEDAPF